MEPPDQRHDDHRDDGNPEHQAAHGGNIRREIAPIRAGRGHQRGRGVPTIGPRSQWRHEAEKGEEREHLRRDVILHVQFPFCFLLPTNPPLHAPNDHFDREPRQQNGQWRYEAEAKQLKAIEEFLIHLATRKAALQSYLKASLAIFSLAIR